MRRIHEDAQKLVDQWTKGLEVVAVIHPYPESLMTVSKDDRGRYHATAYFDVFGTWHVSGDAQGVSADEAFKAVSKRFSV